MIFMWFYKLAHGTETVKLWVEWMKRDGQLLCLKQLLTWTVQNSEPNAKLGIVKSLWFNVWGNLTKIIQAHIFTTYVFLCIIFRTIKHIYPINLRTYRHSTGQMFEVSQMYCFSKAAFIPSKI